MFSIVRAFNSTYAVKKRVTSQFLQSAHTKYPLFRKMRFCTTKILYYVFIAVSLSIVILPLYKVCGGKGAKSGLSLK